MRRESEALGVIGTVALVAAMTIVVAAQRADAEALPIFDAHIHYSHDVWKAIPPEGAVAKLRAAGINRALVSSSSDEGTQRLYEAAPDLVLPSLRPYRKRGELQSWLHDESVIPYLESRLARYRYVAIGEFHVNGADADVPVVRRVVELAREYDLILHAHADADAIERLFAQDPKARILWAHAGFEDGSRVLELMRKYDTLWADLSFRHEIYLNGRFLPVWRELLTECSDRFMIGVDTYTPQRWLHINDELVWMREMLGVLPQEAAERIAYKNGERVIAARFR